MNLLVLADGFVGLRIVQHLFAEFRDDLRAVITVTSNEISEFATQHGIPTHVHRTDDDLSTQLCGEYELGLLAWWPKIIKEPLISVPIHGFINTHPSLLPFNRGKHYSFWALAEQVPFGVTLHVVDQGIDSGDIIAQSSIPYDWSDTGETLYHKAQVAMIDLFTRSYPSIRTGNVTRTAQDLSAGSFHGSSEIEKASCIDLDKPCTPRQLFNLLRARTFPGRPTCRFEDNGESYEVSISIKKASK